MTDSPSNERDAYLRRRYGITEGDYDAMGAAQEWRCAICIREFPPNGHDLRVDHNHKNGVVRGLLCNECNTGLGLLDDSSLRLAAAIVYLEHHHDGEDGY